MWRNCYPPYTYSGKSELSYWSGSILRTLTGIRFARSDDYFAQLKKERALAQILLDEINDAMKQQPSLTLANSFNTRCLTLSSRLNAIGHPSIVIPRPRHPLVPEHTAANEEIHQVLAAELTATMKASRLAQARAKEYLALTNASNKASTLFSQAEELCAKLSNLEDRLRSGLSLPEGDASPPDLSDALCLDPTRHGAYVALLPTLYTDIDTANASAQQISNSLRGILLQLRSVSSLQSFVVDADTVLNKLDAQLEAVFSAKQKATVDADTLRKSRAIWNRSTELKTRILSIKEEIMEAIDTQQWKPTLGRDGIPLTPESMRSLQLDGNVAPTSPATLAARDVKTRIDAIEQVLIAEVRKPLAEISPRLGEALAWHLESGSREVASQLETLRSLVGVLHRVQVQADSMRDVISESYDLDGKIDALRAKIQEAIDDTLREVSWVPNESREKLLGSEVEDVRNQISTFSSSLATRVPFVSSTQVSPSASPHLAPPHQDPLQRKIAALDQAVRSDVNSVCMSLAGRADALKRRLDLYSLADMARLMDSQLDTTSKAILSASSQLSALSSTADQLITTLNEMDHSSIPDLEEDFAGVLSALDILSAQHTSAINAACGAALNTLRQMRASPGARDSGVHDDILNHRSRAFEDIEARVYAFQQEMGVLRAKVIEGRRLAENRSHEEKLRLEREEMLRRGSVTQAELEASRQALRESEAKALAAQEEQKRLELERLRREEEARLEAQARLDELAKEAALREEEARLRREEAERQEAARLAKEASQRELEEARRLEDEARAAEAARLKQDEEARRAAEAAAAAAALEAGELGCEVGSQTKLNYHRLSDAARQAQLDAEISAVLSRVEKCRKDLRSLGIVLAAQPEFESIDDAVSPLPTTLEADQMRAKFDRIVERVAEIGNERKDTKISEALQLMKVELEASRVLLGRVDHLATFGHKVELCDAALSDLLEHTDTYPDPPEETSSSHVPDSSKLAVDQLEDRLRFCEGEMASLHSAFGLVDKDPRALSESTRVSETWEDIADTAKKTIITARAALVPKKPIDHRPKPSLLPSPMVITRRPIVKERSPGPPEPSRLRTISSNSSLKKPFIAPQAGPNRLRPIRSRSPSKASNRSISGPAGGPSTPNSGTFKVPPMPARPASRTSVRSVSGPQAATSSSGLYGAQATSSRQRTISTTSSIRGRTAPQAPSQSSIRTRKQSTTAHTRPASPALSTVSVESASSIFGNPNVHPKQGSSRRPSVTQPRKSISTPRQSISTPVRPPRQKREYIANPKNKLDVAVGAVVNKLPADVLIQPVLDTWKDESGKYWIGDAEPRLCFCRILRSQRVMVRVGGGWIELSK